MDSAEREFWEMIRDTANVVRRRRNVALSAAAAALALEQEIEARLAGEQVLAVAEEPAERQEERQ